MFMLREMLEIQIWINIHTWGRKGKVEAIPLTEKERKCFIFKIQKTTFHSIWRTWPGFTPLSKHIQMVFYLIDTLKVDKNN